MECGNANSNIAGMPESAQASAECIPIKGDKLGNSYDVYDMSVKYLLRDGLEIGMSAGTRSNPQCFSLQYLINLILLLVRGESVAD